MNDTPHQETAEPMACLGTPASTGTERDHSEETTDMTAYTSENRYDAIPQELRELEQWVVWKTVWRDGKLTKVPYNARTGAPASSTNPSDSCTYDEAVAAAPRYSGIGFVFSKDDPYVGIDLDHCRNAQTGVIEPWAQEIITRFGCYAEISVSETGVHIFIEGKIPGARRRKDRIEMYSEARYFVMTGNALPGTPPTIEDRQAELDALYGQTFGEPDPDKPQAASSERSTEEARKTTAVARPVEDTPVAVTQDMIDSLIMRAINAKNGERFKKLWAGDWEDDYTSQSEADAALLGMLRFWTSGNKELSFAIFEKSGLYREKWGRADYRERTWNAVNSGDVYGDEPADSTQLSDGKMDAKRLARQLLPDPVNVLDWILLDVPAPEPILVDCIDKGTKVVVVGPSKSRKSWFVSYLAIALTLPLPAFLRWKINGPKRVCLLNLELLDSSMHGRLKHMIIGLDSSPAGMEDRLQVINARGVETSKSLYDQLVAMSLKHRIDVLIIDPVYKLLEGDENKAEHVKELLKRIDQLCEEAKITVIYVMHTGKGAAGDRQAIDMAVGSGIIARDFDTQISLREHKIDGYLVCEVIARNHAPADPFTIRWSSGSYAFEEAHSVAPAIKTSKDRTKTKIDAKAIEKAIVEEISQRAQLPSATAFLCMLKENPAFALTDAYAKEMKKTLLERGLLKEHREKGKNGHTLIGTPEQIARLEGDDGAQKRAA